MYGDFFQSLNYTSVNEDWRTEATALRVGPGDTVLCVTGSGDRPLHTLAHDPQSVIAIDRNPAQNHLLLLKVAAMRQLAYADYAVFLGLSAAPPRWRDEVWRELRSETPAMTRAFWDDRVGMIRAGVIYQGRWERFYRHVSRLSRLLRPRVIRRLFEFDDLDEQRNFVRRFWDTPVWRAAFAGVCSPLSSRILLRDPAYYAHAAVPVATELFTRMTASLHRYVARNNFMIALILTGRLSRDDLPPYLTAVGYEAIRPKLDRLSVLTADVTDHVHSGPPGRITRFSLSDVPSFLSAAGFERLLDGLAVAGASGSRVVIRQFLTRYPLTERFRSSFTCEPALAAQLSVADRAFAYDFLIAEKKHA